MPARKARKTIGRKKTPSREHLAGAVPLTQARALLPSLVKEVSEDPDREIGLSRNGEIVAWIISANRMGKLRAPTALAVREGKPKATQEVKLVSDIKAGLRNLKKELEQGLADEWHDLNHR